MRRLPALLLTAFLFALSLAAVAVAQDDPVDVRLEIFVVSQVTNDDGTRGERFSPATSARPGQTVEYRVFAENVSDETLPAGIVVLYGPIPVGTRFVENSATPSSERVLTEFSADGGDTFSEPPVFIGAGEDRKIAPAADYTAVRWTLLEPMEPGDEVTLVYRVVVE